MGKVRGNKKNKRGGILTYYYKFAVIGLLSLIIIARMLVVLSSIRLIYSYYKEDSRDDIRFQLSC